MKLEEAIRVLDSTMVDIGHPPREEWETIKQAIVELQEMSYFLECLEAAGVDNWEGYSEAGKMMCGEGEYGDDN